MMAGFIFEKAGKPELPVWAQWGSQHCLDCAECAVAVSLHRYSVSPAGLREHSVCSGFVSTVTLFFHSAHLMCNVFVPSTPVRSQHLLHSASHPPPPILPTPALAAIGSQASFERPDHNGSCSFTTLDLPEPEDLLQSHTDCQKMLCVPVCHTASVLTRLVSLWT